MLRSPVDQGFLSQSYLEPKLEISLGAKSQSHHIKETDPPKTQDDHWSEVFFSGRLTPTLYNYFRYTRAKLANPHALKLATQIHTQTALRAVRSPEPGKPT